MICHGEPQNLKKWRAEFRQFFPLKSVVPNFNLNMNGDRRRTLAMAGAWSRSCGFDLRSFGNDEKSTVVWSQRAMWRHVERLRSRIITSAPNTVTSTSATVVLSCKYEIECPQHYNNSISDKNNSDKKPQRNVWKDLPLFWTDSIKQLTPPSSSHQHITWWTDPDPTASISEK